MKRRNRCVAVRRPFRPSLSSFSRMNSSLKPVQELTVFGDHLLRDITLVGGNQSGIFVSTVKSGSLAEKSGLREGHHLLLVGGLRSALLSSRNGCDVRFAGRIYRQKPGVFWC